MEPTGVGIHIKTRDRVNVLDAVRAAMEAEGLSWVGGGMDAPNAAARMLLLPPRGSWTSLYPERPDLARELASLIALQLKTDVLVVGRLEEAAFFYVFFNGNGSLGDEYHSCPDWSKDVDEDDASEDELERTRGKPAALSHLLSGGVSLDALTKLLKDSRIERLRDHSAHDGPGNNTEPLTRLADALALPDLLEDFDELWHLGLDDEDDIDLRYLAYGRPEEQGVLSKWVDRTRARWAKRRANAEDEPAEAEDDGAKAAEPNDDEAKAEEEANKPDEGALDS